MKITLNQDPAFSETEVIINCPKADEDILHLVAMLRIHQQKLVGTLAGERYLLLGSTPEGLSLLAELTREEGENWNPLQPGPEEKQIPDFRTLMKRLREKK